MFFKRRFRSIIILLVSLMLTGTVLAQEFGGNPPSLRWRQINNDTVRVIFPVGLEEQAADVARIIRQLSSTTQYSIGSAIRKVNMVLQNQTTESNGYVTLGPYRGELFLTPAQNSFELGSLPWHKMLALHEYRHVQQNNNFRKGLSKAFYLAFGEEGQSLATDMAIPNWFWEGDAVFQETLLSRQGRGRIPFFFNDYRSIWAAGKNYSWMKLRNGSYRDLTPDHYRLGYMLVSYGREKYGDTLWARVTDDAARFRGLFYPFQKAVKRTTGKSFPAFRKDALDFFRKDQPRSISDAPAEFARQHKHFDADEEFPQWAGKNSIIYLRSSYKKIPAFHQRNIITGQDKKIAVRDISNDHYFSYRNGRIVYSAYKTDARWGWQDFSVIHTVNTMSGAQRTITKRSRYFSPDISADGSRIVAVLMDTQGKNNLQVLDARSGRVASVMPNENKYVFTYPKFYGNDRVVSAVRNASGEMALGIFDIATGAAKWVTAFTMNPIGFPQVNGDTICFTRSQGNQEKLFAWINGRIYRFTPAEDNLSTGSYQLSVQQGQAAYTTYTSVGYHMYYGKAAFTTAPEMELPDAGYRLRSITKGNDLTRFIRGEAYTALPYKASYGLFNFHSWRPAISDPEYSYLLAGENILNTFQSEVYATYNRNEKYKQTGISLAYAGWYPVLSGGASYTFDRAAAHAGNRISWNEFNAHLGASLPLSFIHGSFTRQVNLATLLNTQQVFYTGASKDMYDNKKFNYGEGSFYFANQQITARQQIYPRFAQTFYARYRSVLDKYTANQVLLSGSVYLPGLFTNHSLVIQAAYQRRDTSGQYNFSNGFPFSRGYSNLDFPSMWKLGVNYHFPIVYPDCGFGNIAYLMRIRGNVYYDHTQVKSLSMGRVSIFRAAGAEIYFDSKWWNQLPISFGVRYSRLLDTDITGLSPNQWELVLPVNLLNR